MAEEVDDQTSFLDLPAELRNAIYELALPYRETIQYSAWRPNLQEPALLAASRQIRAECLESFYSNNTFMCMPMQARPRHLQQLGPERVELLTDFRPFSYCYQRREEQLYCIFEFLKLMQNDPMVESVELDLEIVSVPIWNDARGIESYWLPDIEELGEISGDRNWGRMLHELQWGCRA